MPASEDHERHAPVTVRCANAGDVAFMNSIRPRLSAHAPAGWDVEHVINRANHLVEQALHEARSGEYMGVAESLGAPLGFIYAVTRYSPLMDASYVHILEIVAAQDRRGVGRALLEALESWASAQGISQISLNVVTTNPAREFYKRMGYSDDFYEMSKFIDQPSEIEKVTP